MTGEEIVALCKKHTIFEWSAQDAVDPIPVARAEGVYFWTPEGKRYIDFNSQLMCVNIGHGDPRVVKAIQDQAATLAYANPFMATEPRARLGAKLAALTPGDIDVFFFTNGGAEANENAIKIARAVTGRQKILARYRSYHGGTAAAIAATGDPRRWSQPPMPGVIHVLDPYHGIERGWDDAAAALAYLEEVIVLEGAHTIAGFILESVTGTNGILVPPDGYMQGVRALCDKYGILMIVDEVMAGFGRTGKWFAIEHWNVVPDLITMAKGLTSAYVQLGAVGVRRPIANHFAKTPFPGGLTYNSHPLACAAALAAIDVMEQDGLVEQARTRGELMAPNAGRTRHPPPFSWRGPLNRPLRDRRAGEKPEHAHADGAVQRHLTGDDGAREVLPAGRALHVRAVELLLHQSAALDHGGRAPRWIRDHRPRARDHRQGGSIRSCPSRGYFFFQAP